MIRYSDAVWTRFLTPRRGGTLVLEDIEAELGVDAELFTGRAGSVAENALIELYLAAVGDTIRAARFLAYGCGATVACGDWVADWVEGRTRDDAATLDSAAIAAALQLPALKVRCAVVAERALRDALGRFDRPARQRNDDRPD